MEDSIEKEEIIKSIDELKAMMLDIVLSEAIAKEALRKIAILPSRTGSKIAGETYRELTRRTKCFLKKYEIKPKM